MTRGIATRGALAPTRTWSTERLPEEEQFGFWSQVVHEAFVPVSLQRPDEGGFASRVTGRRLGPLGISRIDSQAQTVTRSLRQTRAGGADVFFLNLPVSPGTWAEQGGRRADLRPRDFTIVDSAHPFALGFDNPFQQFSLTLPREMLASKLARPELSTAVRVDGSTGVGAVASAAVRALAAESSALDAEAARQLAEQVSGLIALAIGGITPTLTRGTRPWLLQAIGDEIERSLGDPALSRTRVAERLSISTRYLDRLLAEQGTSFNRGLLLRRLQRAHDELASGAAAERSISQVARGAGFVDPSYFTRAFRARYGITPSQLRPRPIDRDIGAAGG